MEELGEEFGGDHVLALAVAAAEAAERTAGGAPPVAAEAPGVEAEAGGEGEAKSPNKHTPEDIQRRLALLESVKVAKAELAAASNSPLGSEAEEDSDDA